MLPERIKKIAGEGKLIPVVGAGISMGVELVSGEQAFPSWTLVLKNAADVIGLDSSPRTASAAMAIEGLTGIGGSKNLLRAAQIAQDFLFSEWNGFLDSNFKRNREQIKDESLKTASAIWSIGSSLVITTNYDKVLEWACPDRNVERIGNRQEVELSQILRGENSSPIIWHLHGSINNKSDIVLGEDSYRRLYKSDADGKLVINEPQHVAVHTFRSMLSSYTLLFLGFSMTDDYIRSQLEDIFQLFDGASRHYIVLHESQRELFETRNIPIEVIYVKDFQEDLLQTLGLLKRKSSKRADVEPVYLSADLIEGFSAYQRTQNISDKTITGRLVDLRHFSGWYKADLVKLSSTDISRWLKECETQGLKSGTISRRLSSLKSLFEFLNNSNILDKDPTYKLKAKNKSSRNFKSIPIDVVRSAIKALPISNALDKRNAAIFLVTYYCGLWTEEVTKLSISDVDFDSETLLVTNTNGNSRQIPLREEVRISLTEWINSHPSGTGSLFCSMSAEALPLGNGTVLNAIKKAFKNIGLEGGYYNPRSLRHTLGLQLTQENLTPLEISKIMGHKNVYSTSRYYDEKQEDQII